MRLPRFGVFWLLAVLPATASTVVTNEPTVSLRGGDALSFRFSFSNYLDNKSSAPARVSFRLFSLPFGAPPDFGAALESADGAIWADMGGLSVGSGIFQGTFYNGPISIVSGSLDISPGLAGLFSGPAAVLILRNKGGDVALGLPPYGMASDMAITLSGGGFTAGGPVVSAELQPAAQPAILLGDSGAVVEADNASGTVPEPSSPWLTGAAGAFIFLLSRVLKRRFGSRIQRV